VGLFWDPVKIRPISSILTCTFRFLFGLSPPPPPLPSSLSVVVCYTCSIPCAGICLPCSPKVVCWKQLRLCIPTPSLWFKCLIVITLVIVKNCCLKLEINIFTVYCLHRSQRCWQYLRCWYYWYQWLTMTPISDCLPNLNWTLLLVIISACNCTYTASVQTKIP
jgi:hypothetical protein